MDIAKVLWSRIGGIGVSSRGWCVIFEVGQEEIFELLEVHICAV